eukprot:TRINITY_DN8758_c0_g1_i1.p2 TRINITY_DN8758_c0_g1~~TRINITY_DN8758_c0_g1_i1.p2  ORF type:complete len:301 (-),score=75.13 TRINITY_DN8758_c0_g1_i1:173-1075(-)
MLNRLKLYGRLDYSKNISKKTGAFQKELGTYNAKHNNYYDADDPFIDDGNFQENLVEDNEFKMAIPSVFWQDFSCVKGNINDLKNSKEYQQKLEVKKEVNKQIEKSNEKENEEELEKKRSQMQAKVIKKQPETILPKQQSLQTKSIQKNEKAQFKETKKNASNLKEILISEEKDVEIIETKPANQNFQKQQLQNVFPNGQNLEQILMQYQLQMLAQQQPMQYCAGNILPALLPNEGMLNQNALPLYEALIQEYSKFNNGGNDLLDQILEINKVGNKKPTQKNESCSQKQSFNVIAIIKAI